jgi:creatinine amidohydrolase/Fe(II)-dependent formamide hydrolase-like protein
MHQWAELTWADFQSREMERTIAVLPVAAIEQHGPHLPVGVDTFITTAKGEAAADYGVTAFLELLQDVEAFDLDRLVEGPLD